MESVSSPSPGAYSHTNPRNSSLRRRLVGFFRFFYVMNNYLKQERRSPGVAFSISELIRIFRIDRIHDLWRLKSRN